MSGLAQRIKQRAEERHRERSRSRERSISRTRKPTSRISSKHSFDQSGGAAATKSPEGRPPKPKSTGDMSAVTERARQRALERRKEGGSSRIQRTSRDVDGRKRGKPRSDGDVSALIQGLSTSEPKSSSDQAGKDTHQSSPSQEASEPSLGKEEKTDESDSNRSKRRSAGDMSEIVERVRQRAKDRERRSLGSSSSPVDVKAHSARGSRTKVDINWKRERTTKPKSAGDMKSSTERARQRAMERRQAKARAQEL